jgi:hypothetical protein
VVIFAGSTIGRRPPRCVECMVARAADEEK